MYAHVREHLSLILTFFHCPKPNCCYGFQQLQRLWGHLTGIMLPAHPSKHLGTFFSSLLCQGDLAGQNTVLYGAHIFYYQRLFVHWLVRLSPAVCRELQWAGGQSQLGWARLGGQSHSLQLGLLLRAWEGTRAFFPCVALTSEGIWEKQQVKVGKRGGAVRHPATGLGIWGGSRSSVDSLGNAHLGDTCYLKLPFKWEL